MQREQFQNAVSDFRYPSRLQMRSLYLTPIASQHIRHKKHETRPNPYEGVSQTQTAISPKGAFWERPRAKSLLRRRFGAGAHVIAGITYAGVSRAPFFRPKERLAGAECSAFFPVSLNLLRVFSTRQNVWPVVNGYIQHFRSIIACRKPQDALRSCTCTNKKLQGRREKLDGLIIGPRHTARDTGPTAAPPAGRAT